jgi:uncharacterized protein YqfA (UPF0365 family)
MHLPSTQHAIVAQAQGGNLFSWIMLGVMLLIMLALLIVFARYFSLWLRAFLARAPIPFPQLVTMSLRKTDPREIVRLRIMAVQSGIDIPTHELERAYLTGANVERAVLAMIRAKETGEDITWEQLISADVDERLGETGTN